MVFGSCSFCQQARQSQLAKQYKNATADIFGVENETLWNTEKSCIHFILQQSFKTVQPIQSKLWTSHSLNENVNQWTVCCCQSCTGTLHTATGNNHLAKICSQYHSYSSVDNATLGTLSVYSQ